MVLRVAVVDGSGHSGPRLCVGKNKPLQVHVPLHLDSQLHSSSYTSATTFHRRHTHHPGAYRSVKSEACSMATSSLSSSTNMVEYSGMSMALKHWGGRTHKRSRVRAKSRPSGTQIGHTDRSRNLDCVAQAAVLPHCHAGRSNAMCEGRGGVAVTYRVGEGVGAVPALLRADAELREPVGRPPARQNRLTKRRRRRGPTHCGVRRTGCSRCRTCRQCRVSLQSSGQRWSASECRGTSRGAGGGGGSTVIHREQYVPEPVGLSLHCSGAAHATL